MSKGTSEPLAYVSLSCGRYFLVVAGIVLAMETDRCRHSLPDEVAEPIPADELERATIGGEPVKEVPLELVRFFRGENWTKRSLDWAAEQINAKAASPPSPAPDTAATGGATETETRGGD